MKVAVDLQSLRFTHVHEAPEIVSGLVYLECAKLRHVLFDGTENKSFLSKLTRMELNILYKNTTGHEFPKEFDDLTIREVLAGVVNTMTPRDVDYHELERQIDAVIDDLESSNQPQFMYVKGANKPAIKDTGLFPLTTLPANSSSIQQAATVAPQRREARSATVAAAPAPQRQVRPAGPRNTGQGGARPQIFAHADKRWEEAGKPMNKDAVLVLRKKWMAELEEMGIKKSTSSTALGDWMKDRIN